MSKPRSSLLQLLRKRKSMVAPALVCKNWFNFASRYCYLFNFKSSKK